MSNVLNEEKQKQVIALGQLGWSLRKIEKATGVRRETAAGYLKAAGLGLRPPRSWGKKPAAPSNPANGVTTDSTPAPSALSANPANEVTTDFSVDSAPVAASFCEPFRTIIEDELGRGRNAMGIWQHLVDRHGFTGSYQSVKRFVRRQNSPTSKVAHPVIETAPGEGYGECRVMVRGDGNLSVPARNRRHDPATALHKFATGLRAT